jgi:hypothetical protein
MSSCPISPKNKLIQFSSVKKLDSPQFQTQKVGGSDFNPIYETTVKFLNTVVKDTGYGKKQAEFNACCKFLKLVPIEDKSTFIEWVISLTTLIKIASNYIRIRLINCSKNFDLFDGTERDLNLYITSEKDNFFKDCVSYIRPINSFILLYNQELTQDNKHLFIIYLLGWLQGKFPNVIIEISNDDELKKLVEMF